MLAKTLYSLALLCSPGPIRPFPESSALQFSAQPSFHGSRDPYLSATANQLSLTCLLSGPQSLLGLPRQLGLWLNKDKA